MHTVVQSASKTVTIGHDQPFVIIGERINPTGRKKFQELLRAGDLSTIAIDVEAQIKGGADMLDVNMGVPLTDEPALLSAAIKMIQGITDIPICIDSSVIIRAVEKHGISLDNLVIDPLAMTVGADPEAVKITLETIHLIREKFGLNMTLGASNISFGLPNRHALNAAFLPAAMSHGLTCAVMDARTPAINEAVRAADLLLGMDQWGGNWISRFRAQEAAKAEG